MSVLAPTTTVHVLAPNDAVDAHGHVASVSWQQRGPYQATISGGAAVEDRTDHRRVLYTHTLCIDPGAWPLRSRERVVDDTTGVIYEVVGARITPGTGAFAPLQHVHVDALVLAEAF